MTYAKNESDKMKEYEQKGYTNSYRIIGEKFTNVQTNKTYEPNQIKIVDEYRYEGQSNPSDLSILFIIETLDGEKGSVLVPYGPTGNTEMAEFFKEVSLQNYDKTDLNKV